MTKSNFWPISPLWSQCKTLNCRCILGFWSKMLKFFACNFFLTKLHYWGIVVGENKKKLFLGLPTYCWMILVSVLSISPLSQKDDLFKSISADGDKFQLVSIETAKVYKGTRQKRFSGFWLLKGYPPPTPLTDNHFAKKPLAERGGNPPPP